jgi:hypothetical protein
VNGFNGGLGIVAATLVGIFAGLLFQISWIQNNYFIKSNDYEVFELNKDDQDSDKKDYFSKQSLFNLNEEELK